MQHLIQILDDSNRLRKLAFWDKYLSHSESSEELKPANYCLDQTFHSQSDQILKQHFAPSYYERCWNIANEEVIRSISCVFNLKSVILGSQTVGWKILKWISTLIKTSRLDLKITQIFHCLFRLTHLSRQGLIFSKFSDLLEAQGVELAELPRDQVPLPVPAPWPPLPEFSGPLKQTG